MERSNLGKNIDYPSKLILLLGGSEKSDSKYKVSMSNGNHKWALYHIKNSILYWMEYIKKKNE